MQITAEIKVAQKKRDIQWELYFGEHGRGVSMYHTSEVRKLVLEGVPDNKRREVWLVFSGMIPQKSYRVCFHVQLEKILHSSVIFVRSKRKKISKFCRVAVINAKNHKHQRRKRQSLTAKREKLQTPKVLSAILT